MGLDKDDTIVKRRMAQKMEFLAEDVAAAHEPTTEELKAWFAEEHDAIRAACARHVPSSLLLARPPRAERARRRRGGARSRSSPASPRTAPAAPSLGDPFMFQDYLRRSHARAGRQGVRPGVRQARSSLAAGCVDRADRVGLRLAPRLRRSLTPARVPTFEEVEPDVKTAWLADQKAEAWGKAYKAMRAKYELLLPAPPAPEKGKP